MTPASDSAESTLELVVESEPDRAFLARLYASTRMEELAPLPWSDDQKLEFLRAQFEAQDQYYREYYADTVRRLIQIDGANAGRLYVQHRKDELRVVDIALLPEYRGHGVGGRLVEQILDDARAAGKAVRIHVEKNNPAYRLYRRLDFKPLEDKGVYDLLEWRPVADPCSLSATPT